MADQVTNYQCPACTGPLHFDGKLGKLKCDYCGSTFTVREVEELFAARNASAVSASEAAREKEKKEALREEALREEMRASGAAAQDPQDPGAQPSSAAEGGWGKDAAKMRAYSCSSCGAELICDETTAATQCPYCGNNTIIPGQFAGTMKPDYVIPFRKEKKDAVEALKEYYKGKLLLPGSFGSSNHLEEVKGVYVPFWLYSGHVDAKGRYEAKIDQVFQEGEYKVTRTKHYEVAREGTIEFSRIPVDASTKMPDDLMDSIEPFDYGAITDFSLAYMPGYLANKYDVSKEECRSRAVDRARQSAEDALRGTVTGYSSVSTSSHEEKIRGGKTEYAVLPVWLLSTNWEGQNFLFAMNGQTGRMIGNLPVSKAKQAIWFFAVFVLSFLVFAAFLLGGEGDVELSSWLIALAFALVPAFIVGAVLVGQMKPVAMEKRAAAYVTDSGLRLKTKEDRYIRTTESRVKIQNDQKR